jgi:NAD(P)-dependent dehydrogenase (short-subunit alcohol dehydrogenase family)
METVLITGADRGIGAALARQYRARGDRVIAACLGDGAHLVAEDIEVAPNVDVTNMASLTALAERLHDTTLSLLISNAGAFAPEGWLKFDYERMLHLYDVNALGPLRAVDALTPRLAAGSKIGIITSRVGSLSDNSSGGLYGYRMSKCAANMLGINLYHQLRPHGIAVMLLHPGQVATEMTRGLSDLGDFITPEISAAGLIEQVDALHSGTPPEFRHTNGTLLPW